MKNAIASTQYMLPLIFNYCQKEQAPVSPYIEGPTTEETAILLEIPEELLGLLLEGGQAEPEK